VPPSISPAGAQGGTLTCRSGAALSFVSCIRLFDDAARASHSAVFACRGRSFRRLVDVTPVVSGDPECLFGHTQSVFEGRMPTVATMLGGGALPLEDVASGSILVYGELERYDNLRCGERDGGTLGEPTRGRLATKTYRPCICSLDNPHGRLPRQEC
jgi:hypothetical protein